MTRTVVFVHGTGVRADDYRRSFSLVTAGIGSVWPMARVEPCSWGEKVGVTLAHGGRSIPDFSGQAAPSDAEAASKVLWELLSADPAYEWRELTGTTPPTGFVDGAAQVAAQAFPRRLAALGLLAEAIALLPKDDDAGTRAARWVSNCQAVADSPELMAALKSYKRIDARFRQAAARACVARWQWQHAFASSGMLTASARDTLVQRLFDELGGADAGRVSDWVKDRFKGALLRWATDRARRKRDVLYNAAYPVAGDILRYQARGEPIRQEIGARIDACIAAGSDDIVVLAHSLGGIACVDLLVREPRREVKALVTCGSQAPLLYELGALISLSPDEALPAGFPPKWINVYDRDDLLSYLAAPLFAPVARDIELRSGLPFPDSHGAYWQQPELWQRLAEALPAA
jgi:hypothetical protein